MEQIKKKRGGKRENAGRKKGVLMQRSQEILAEAARAGITPLEFLLNVLRDEAKAFDDRFKAAVQAAPYMHPRLEAIEHSGGLEHSMVSDTPEVQPEEWTATHADNGSAH